MVKNPRSKKDDPAGDAGAQPAGEIRYPRRTERRRRTRAKILEVAAEQFSTGGYGPTTMQAIAEAADVHVTTLFMHFKSKGDLALSLVAAETDQLRERAFRARESDTVFDFVRAEALGRAKALQEAASPEQSLWYALSADQELAFAGVEYEREQTSVIADYVAAEWGLDREKDVRPDLVAALLLSAATLPIRRWVDKMGKGKPAAEIAGAVDMAERAARDMLGAGV